MLLLEADPQDRYPWIHVPLGYGKTMLHEPVNGYYYTEPNTNLHDCCTMYWPCGKVQDGPRSIHGLISIRGQKEDYDHWEAVGNARPARKGVPPYEAADTIFEDQA